MSDERPPREGTGGMCCNFQEEPGEAMGRVEQALFHATTSNSLLMN